jgi:hypothetical protein
MGSRHCSNHELREASVLRLARSEPAVSDQMKQRSRVALLPFGDEHLPRRETGPATAREGRLCRRSPPPSRHRNADGLETRASEDSETRGSRYCAGGKGGSRRDVSALREGETSAAAVTTPRQRQW